VDVSPWQRPSAGSPPDGPPGLGGGQPPYQPTPPPGYRPGYAPSPPPPPYPPPAPAPGPPVSRARSARKVLALVGAAALAAVVLVAVLVLVVFRGGPRETADAFMAALQAKDVGKAHGLLCRDGRQRESEEELRRGFDLETRTITAYRLGTERQRQREGKEETLIPVAITYDQGPEVEIDLGVWEESGRHRVCSLNPPGG